MPSREPIQDLYLLKRLDDEILYLNRLDNQLLDERAISQVYQVFTYDDLAKSKFLIIDVVRDDQVWRTDLYISL